MASSLWSALDVCVYLFSIFFFFQAEDGIRDVAVTGVQTCALPIYRWRSGRWSRARERDGKRPALVARTRGAPPAAARDRSRTTPALPSRPRHGDPGGGAPGDIRWHAAGRRRGSCPCAHRAGAPARPPWDRAVTWRARAAPAPVHGPARSRRRGRGEGPAGRTRAASPPIRQGTAAGSRGVRAPSLASRPRRPARGTPHTGRGLRETREGPRRAATTGAAETGPPPRSEEHTSELQSRLHLVCRLLLEKKKNKK